MDINENFTGRLWFDLKTSLNEGGWRMPALTSKTPLTPDTVDRSMKVLSQFESALGAFLKSNPITSVSKRGKGSREMDTSKPLNLKTATGSTHYYKVDKEQQKKVTYGDIDVLAVIPVFIQEDDPKKQRQEELWYLSAYKQQIRNFITQHRPKEISSQWLSSEKSDDVGKEPYLILDIGGGEFVQIDLVYSFSHSAKWDVYRGRPERGLKGFVTGMWFSSITDVLNISLNLGDSPLQNQNIASTLFVELLKSASNNPNADVSYLKGYEGISVEDFTFKYLVEATRRLAIGLEKNKVMSKVEFKNKILQSFTDRMNRQIKSPKFKKVFSGEASDEENKNYQKVVKAAERGLDIAKSLNESKNIGIQNINQIQNKIFVLTSGGMGTGKSYVVDKNLNGFIVLDVDDEKKKFGKDINDKAIVKPAQAVVIAKFKQALKNGKNIVYQGISPNIHGITNKMKAAKKMGYTTVLLRIESDNAIQNTQNRIDNGGHGDIEQVKISAKKSLDAFNKMKDSDLIDYVVIHKN